MNFGLKRVQQLKTLGAPHTIFGATVFLTEERVLRLGCAKANSVNNLELFTKINDSYKYVANTFLAETDFGECFRYEELWTSYEEGST